ncbi:MAG: SMP-30/gluconolactonase/LRE family protein [Woeseiaceae bacterium]
MVKTLVSTAVFILVVVSAYLAAWPVPVEPVSWEAPEDLGLVDPFELNDLLRAARGIELNEYEGPEDASIGVDGSIYLTTSGGHILQVNNRKIREFAYADGRPLGIETDADGSLVVANAYLGLQRIERNGTVSTLLREVDGRPLIYANNLAIGPDRTVYFSESSSKFGAMSANGTYEASLLDILEHGGHGRVFAFDPATGNVELLMEKLNFANGVAVSRDGRFLLVSETGHYRILKHWLTGDRKGRTEVLLDNLPGFPDNLKNGAQGRFWLGLAAPRNHLLDRLSAYPKIRKLVQRLPAALRPKAASSSHVIAFNGDGEVLMNLHDPVARYATLTGVLETNRALYLTTLYGNQLPRLDKRDL